MNETTHQMRDGRMVQVVSPQRLRQILRQNGDSQKRPKDFRPEDEWILPKRR